jgi:hypothetical protein
MPNVDSTDPGAITSNLRCTVFPKLQYSKCTLRVQLLSKSASFLVSRALGENALGLTGGGIKYLTSGNYKTLIQEDVHVY